jgi:hypothetical protein
VTSPARLTLALVTLAGVLLSGKLGAAEARTSAAWMTPAAMAKKIRGLVPQIPTTNTGTPSIISAATCRGLGKTHRNKAAPKYSRFRCTATWGGGKSRVWARALPRGRFCASSTGLSACPAGTPVAGDPRICSNRPAPPTADPNHCALSASEASVLRAMKVWFENPDWAAGNVSCKGSNLTRTCTFMQLGVYGVYYTSHIHFAKTTGVWVATIATTGNNKSSTCTVLSGHTAAGKPSNWTAGPTPTC